jgi:Uma2 family endonuclease
MATLSNAPSSRGSRRTAIPPLENGDHLSATEFLRRYEAMPEVKKAELIQGIVYMASPVRIEEHGEPDGTINTWLGTYAAKHPGVRHAINTTIQLGPDDTPQPDGLLFRQGGACGVDATRYLSGPPELVVEIAASSVSRDAREKLITYRRARISEYLLWRVEDEVIDWFVLEDDEYRPLPISDSGIIESRAFPGLRLDVPAALRLDAAAVLAAFG